MLKDDGNRLLIWEKDNLSMRNADDEVYFHMLANPDFGSALGQRTQTG